MTAVQEDSQLVTVAPEGRATQFPTACRQQLTKLVALAVEPPEFLAGFRIERRNVVVRRRDVQDAVEHQRHRFELAWRRAVLFERHVEMFPLPRDLQAL